jgi:hypothetical protein
MIKRVVEVRPLGGYRLFIRFDDGVQGEVDVASFVRFDGVFEPLRDLARFAEAFVDLGTVCWPDDLDLAPEVLYEKVGSPALGLADPPEGDVGWVPPHEAALFVTR